MERYDIFLSYSHKDHKIAGEIHDILEDMGVSVFWDLDLLPGCDYSSLIMDRIRIADCMFILLSENSMNSRFIIHEVHFAVTTASERDKLIIPVLIDSAELSGQFRLILGKYQMLRYDSRSPGTFIRLITPVIERLKTKKEKTRKYEELSELRKSCLYLEAAAKLTEIINIILDGFDDSRTLREQYEPVIELDKCLKELHDMYGYVDGDYSKRARQVTQLKLDVLDRLSRILTDIPRDLNDMFYLSGMIRFIYWDREVRRDCADMITHGDVGAGIVHTLPKDEYADRQSVYRNRYLRAPKDKAASEPLVVADFIRNTEEFLYDKPKHTVDRERPERRYPTQSDERLQAIAGYIREGNRIFELIGEDEKAASFLKCLITSYERLKNYCEEIGAGELVAECIEKIALLKQRYMNCAGSDDEPSGGTPAEKSIRALLGFSRPGTGEYDVFLSHKSFDIDIAQNVYQFLKSNMQEVFLDKISLPELSRTEYKNAILQALDRSRSVVVIVTDFELLRPQYDENAGDWLQKEMNTFHSEMFEGRKEGGTFVILVTDEVYNKATENNKKNMDIKWRGYTLIRISEYKDQLMSYLSGK